MDPRSASKVLYIKLGEGNKFWERCKSNSEIVLGFDSGAEPCLMHMRNRDQAALVDYWRGKGKTISVATNFANSMVKFADDNGDTLWVTFAEGMLWWGFSDGKEINPVHDDRDLHGCSFRRLRGKWSCEDLNGNPLFQSELRGSLTRTAAYRGTICEFKSEVRSYLVDRLSGRENEIVGAIENSKRELVTAIQEGIRTLLPAEFEVLIEQIFANSGWQRTTVVGGNLKTSDLELRNPITGERIFVQVKSQTDDAEFQAYRKKKMQDKPNFSQMYFVYHTLRGSALKTCDTAASGEVVWNVADVANQVVNNGLTDWVKEKVK